MGKIIVLITILLFSISCSDKPIDQPIIESQTSIDQLDSLMLNRMKKKRIVMFGDAYHGHGYFYRKVTDYINYWLDKVENDTNVTTSSDGLFSKLVLFLECDEVEENLIKDYIKSGYIVPYLTHNIELLLKVGGWNMFTVDRVEFLYNLKGIYKRVDEINQRFPGKNIEFQIRGVEADPPYSDKINDLNFMRNEFPQERFKWFAKERDQYSSKNIIKFLDENSEYKALIFYGTAHLLRGKREKIDHFVKESKFDYYQAQYLDNHFGRNNVSIFMTQKILKNSTNHIDILMTDKTGPDYIVYCKPIPIYPCPLFLIKSNNIIQIYHTLLQKQNHNNEETDNNYDMRYMYDFIRYISTLYLYDDPKYKRQFDSLRTILKVKRDMESGLTELIEMSNNLQTDFDAIKNIKEIDKWTMSYEINQDNYFSNQFQNILKNFHPKSLTVNDTTLNLNKLFNEKTGMTSMSEYQNITNTKDYLIEYFLIKLLWIGTNEENRKAVSYLKQVTHLEYNNAEEWNRYLINKFKTTQ